mgnify:CR=1 FL=1
MSNDSNFARFGSGQAVNRMEDRALVEGYGVYTDDVTLDRQTHMLFLRSPHAHAHIAGIDTGPALALPGVAAIYTARDLVADKVGHLPAISEIKDEPDYAAALAALAA